MSNTSGCLVKIINSLHLVTSNQHIAGLLQAGEDKEATLPFKTTGVRRQEVSWALLDSVYSY